MEKAMRLGIRVIGLLLFVTSALMLQSGVSADEMRELTIHDFAVKAAPKLAEEIADARARTVAVFPFRNDQQRESPVLGNIPSLFQGELIRELQRRGKDKFKVLTREELEKRLEKAGSIDPIELSEEGKVSGFLKAVGLDVAVIGSIDMKSLRSLKGKKWVEIAVNLFFGKEEGGKESKRTFTGQVNTVDLCVNCGVGTSLDPGGHVNSKGRFKVEILGPDGKPLELRVCQNLESEFNNVYFLILDRSLEGKNYQIRLTNRGEPMVGYKQPEAKAARDRDRLFSVAVLVDGVNSIFEDQGDGSFGPVVRHPKEVTKWVLTGPGKRLVPTDDPQTNTAGILGGKLQDVKGEGGSVVCVPGFQANAKTALKFTFVTARESIAAKTIGSKTNDVGMIAVHFYAQILETPPDEMENYLDKLLAMGGDLVRHARRPAGTTAGQARPNQVFRVHFRTYEQPVEVWRIFYRFQDEALPIDSGGTPINRSDLKSVSGEEWTR